MKYEFLIKVMNTVIVTKTAVCRSTVVLPVLMVGRSSSVTQLRLLIGVKTEQLNE